MVSATISRTARETTQTLDDRDVTGIAIVALSSAGGVIVSQVVAEQVADLVDVSTDPAAGATPFAVAVGSKVATAIGFGVVATSLGGLGLVAGAFMALGALASAGTDVVDALLRSAPLDGNQTRSRTRSRSSNRKRVKASVSQTPEEIQFRGRSPNGGGGPSKNTEVSFR